MRDTALLVIDTQVELLSPDNPAIHDRDGVVARLGQVLDRARHQGVPLIFVQHEDPPGTTMARGRPGWQFVPELGPLPGESLVSKTASDSFYRTDLDELLRSLGVRRVVVTGCKTEFCVDTTCRHATSLGYDVVLLGDCHTTEGNEQLSGEQVVRHTNVTLDEFGNDDHEIAVVSSPEFGFTD